MKVKNILIGTGLLATGYCAEKIVACVQCCKLVLDGVEELFPGAKKDIAKRVSNSIIDEVFKDHTENVEEEEA